MVFQCRPQAWLTYATHSEHVSMALVLVNSIRKTQTTYRVGVISSICLSKEDRSILQEAFDDIFLLDFEDQCGYANTNGLSGLRDEYLAKVFAFSLEVFSKVVLLEPNSLFLENCDQVFAKTQGNIVSLTLKVEQGNTPADYFALTPCKAFGKYLEGLLMEVHGSRKKSGFSEILKRYSNKWEENNKFELKVEYQDNNMESLVAQLSLKTGALLKRDSWELPAIVQLSECYSSSSKQLEQIQTLLTSDHLALTERAVLLRCLSLLFEIIKCSVPGNLEFRQETENEPIAIVGMSCRLPGASNLEEFWNLLYAGDESVREPPQFRWKKEHVVTQVGEKERKARAGFLNIPVDEFDAKFFGVNRKEVEFMDPQVRLMHEVMWESLENAGVDPSSLSGSHTGVFTGSWTNDYKEILYCSAVERDFFRYYIGNSIGAAAARLSFLLGSTGPCIATESGCSSATVALDMAVKSLRRGETNLALVGGVNLLLHPFTNKFMDFFIAPDGRCKTFDAKADGFVRAEGCGFLVLKRLSDALKDRDHIWSLIRGSAVSQEGISKSLGTPTVHCEALAMELAMKDAGVRPEQVSFVETHGTGTIVGDPMEVAAIAKAYHTISRNEPLVIASVKTIIGHTESCSGITGIIKTVLSMKHELIPKHRNLEILNPEINLESIPAVIPLEPISWPKIPGQPRFAGVSSFGITGTDTHVILQETPGILMSKMTFGLKRPLHILKISTKDTASLDQLLGVHRDVFMNAEGHDFADFAYTGNVGRADFDHRSFILASNFKGAVAALEGNKIIRGTKLEPEKKNLTCFLFSGQGSQYWGMGNSIYESSPVFQFYFDQCDKLLRKYYSVDIRKVLWGGEGDSKEINRTIFSQTGIFVVEYCLLQLWRSWGLKPDVVLGHSLGEFCAAVAAGMLTFEDALRLVAERSRLIDNLPRGSMLVLKASKPDVEKAMKEAKLGLDFAVLNSLEQTVVAGDTEKVEELLAFCIKKDMKGRILEATHAFHSHHMEPMLKEYRKVAAGIVYRDATQCQYISGMEGIVKKKVDSEYWVRHTREKVNFLEACRLLQETEVGFCVEIGPQPVLSTFVMQNVERQMACLPSLRKKTDEWQTMLTSLGKLWVAGYKVDWMKFDKPYDRKKVSLLPTYPFQRKSFWVDTNELPPLSIHPLVGAKLSNASNLSIYQNDLNLATLPYLRDHCIGNRVVFPGAAFAEICLAAGYIVSSFLRDSLDAPRQPVALENLRIEAPLELKEGKPTRSQVIVDLPENENDKGKQNSFRCRMFHRHVKEAEICGSENWVPHATAEFLPVVADANEILQRQWSGKRVQEMIMKKESNNMDTLYKRIDSVGLKFGEAFRSVGKDWSEAQEEFQVDEVVAEVKVPVEVDKYLLHPLIIDAMFQAQILAGAKASPSKMLRVPVRVGRLVLFGTLPEVEAGEQVVYIHVRWWDKDTCTVYLCTQDFRLVALMEQLELLETNAKTIHSVLESQNSEVPDCWEEQWKPLSGISDKRLVLTKTMELVTNSPGFLSETKSVSKDTAEAHALKQMVSRLVTLYAYRAMLQLGWRPTSGDELSVEEFCSRFGVKEKHLRKQVYFYFGCFQEELKLMEVLENGETWKVCQLPIPTEDEVTQEIQVLYDKLVKVEKLAVVTQVYEHVAKHLSQVLVGEKTALEILFPLDPDQKHLSAETYYRQYPGKHELICISMTIMRYLLSEFKAKPENRNKVLRVLEVGAGTASIALPAIKELTATWGSKVEYYFTDISASFFTKAEKLLEEFKGQVKYATFNIEEHPLPQGIPLNYFDMVLATDVLHATRDLAESLAHLRLVLRPYGLLLFTETVCPEKGITFVFGLLEGYWRFQDFERRPHHACVSLQTWKELLTETGFGYVYAEEAGTNLFGIIAGEATGYSGFDPVFKIQRARKEIKEEEKSKEKSRWVLCMPNHEQGKKVISKVGEALSDSGYEVKVACPKTELKMEENDVEVEVNEIFKEKVVGVVYAWGMTPETVKNQNNMALPLMYIVKRMLSMEMPPRLYVLTRNVHCLTEEENNPGPATLWGMAKSLKNENSDLLIRCVDLSGDGGWEVEVDQVLYELALCKETKENERLQVCYRGGQRWEPRLNRIPYEPRSKTDLQLPPSTNRYQLVLPETRVVNDLEFKALEEYRLEPGEIEVRCQAYALNFRDLLAILKPIEEFEKTVIGVGLDFAGVVSKVGPEVTKWKVGDRVFGVNFNETPLPTHIFAKEDSILKMPEKFTYVEACTLPAVFATSIHSLMNIAQIKNGDTVLIHTGSGGVGLAAIQLAKHVGAEIITTAGSPRKRAYLRNLGIQYVFHSRDTSFEQDILRVTNGRGVDVVLNSITGPGLKEATLAVCAKNARFVEMSKLNVWTPEEVKERRPDVQYCIVDLSKFEERELKHLQDKANEFLKDANASFIPFVKFDALRIRQAFQFFQKAKHIGKVVVTMPEVKVEEGQWKVKVNLFDSDSTYLITGGLGGIGFEVCKWMLEKGATDIVLNGRNPPKPEVQTEIDGLNKKPGVNVKVLLADVGNVSECEWLINEITKSGNFKPLRGIQHCAGVVRDNLYGDQDWESFRVTFNPKVKGTWNLHRLTYGLPLEHFVLYSSAAALFGTPGQPNHAAANCFEDALAHHRYSQGLPATSINWGQWAQVGCAKEIVLNGLLPISVQRMLNGMEEAMRSQKIQLTFCDFESLGTLLLVVPTFKHYLDEKLLKSIKTGMQSTQITLQSIKFWEEVDEAKGVQGKLEVVIRYMKEVIRRELRMEPDEPIKDDANMQDLGVDSLMLIELRNSIQCLMGSRLCVSMNMFKDCLTIKDLAMVIVYRVTGQGPAEEEKISVAPLSAEEYEKLLLEDCVLEGEIRPEEGTGRSCVEVEKISTVLVTGPTGQVGPYMLAALSKLENVTRIICLVRTRQGIKPEDKLSRVLKGMNLSEEVDMTKVECVRGDVVKEKFGLEETMWEELTRKVNSVIHLAVKSNHVEAYKKVEGGSGGDIRSANVKGTTNVLRFAVTAQTKSVFYAGAILASFGLLEEADTFCDTWPDLESAKHIAEAGILGYQASKFVCENLLKQVVDRGVPCKVFRMPWVMGDSKTGQLNFQNNHLILRFLTYLKLKAMPSAPVPALLLPVDICVNWSLKLFWNDQAPCGIYNLTHPQPQLEVEFIQIAQREFGVNIQLVDWSSREFVEKMYATEMPLEALKEVYQNSDKLIEVGISDTSQAVKGYINYPDRFFRNPKVAKYLPNFAEGMPTTMDILESNMLYVKNAGYFCKFGIKSKSEAS